LIGKLKVPQMGAPDTSTVAVLAEKPSVARDIARVLGANKQVLLQIAMKRASGSRGRMCELNSDTEQPVNEPDVSDNIPLC
jgi:hypothetical protein